MSDATGKVVLLLEGLGDTPETIAAFLEGQGIRDCDEGAWAERHGFTEILRNLTCPIARYLAAMTGESWSVTHQYVEGPNGECIHTPPPVRNFVFMVDKE